jgi:hypothetical protein
MGRTTLSAGASLTVDELSLVFSLRDDKLFNSLWEIGRQYNSWVATFATYAEQRTDLLATMERMHAAERPPDAVFHGKRKRVVPTIDKGLDALPCLPHFDREVRERAQMH